MKFNKGVGIAIKSKETSSRLATYIAIIHLPLLSHFPNLSPK